MLISIVTPTFNRAERLAKAIASLRGQTYSQWEHIVIDDGDGSGKAFSDSLNEPRIRAFQNPNKGQTPARNFALQQAKGNIIALLDDDDWFDDPFHLEKVVTALKVKPALLHRHGWIVEENNNERKWSLFNLAASPKSLRKDNSILTSSMAYPKHFHDELGLFDEVIGGYFDWDWILRVLDAGHPIHTIKTPGVCYLVHQTSGSANIHGERRTQSFQTFCTKHKLELEIKNHSSLLSEQQ